jgi:hypothetical protein
MGQSTLPSTNYDNKEWGPSRCARRWAPRAISGRVHPLPDRPARLAGDGPTLGITTLTRDDYGLSLTLGGGEVTLLRDDGAMARWPTAATA